MQRTGNRQIHWGSLYGYRVFTECCIMVYSGRNCLIWGTKTISVESFFNGSLRHLVNSPRTDGEYFITTSADNLVIEFDKNKKKRLTSWLVERRRAGEPRPEINTSITGKYLDKRQDLSIQERANRLLEYIEQEVQFLGDPFNFSGDTSDYNFMRMMARSESTEYNEVIYLMNFLGQKSYLKEISPPRHNRQVSQFELTIQGYDRVKKLKNTALEILGHRTPRTENHDLSNHTFSGYAEIDSKLLELRNDLEMLPDLPHGDISHALEVCAGLGNLAGQALSDNLFPEGTEEKEFQIEVVKALRNRPNIGEDLERNPQTGGGITDLSFHRIRIELKAVSDGEISEAKIDKFADQTAQYVVSSGKRIGVLCLLDSRKKTTPPPPAASHLRIIRKEISGAFVPIVFLCVKGGLARPSDLSR